MPSNSSDNTKMSNSPAKKTSATSSKKTAAAPVAAVAPVASPAKSAKKDTPAASVVAPVPASPATVAATEPAAEESVVTSYAGLMTKFNALRSQLNELAPEMKKMEKTVARLEKKAEKRRRRKDGEKKAAGNSVFNKPVRISDELCVFLGKAKGTEVCRSDVTRGVMNYAKEHKLNDKQSIKPDATLRKLLQLTEKDNLSILNLQKFLKHHYPKAATATA